MNRGYKIVWSKVRHAFVVCNEFQRRSGKSAMCASLVLAGTILLAPQAFAETWQQVTTITTERTVSDGRIDIDSPGNPSGTVNVKIESGGALLISDTDGNATISGRVDVTGEEARLVNTSGESINNLTVGALVLHDGANVRVDGNLTGVSEEPHRVWVQTGSSLKVAGEIGGNFTRLDNVSGSGETLEVGSVNLGTSSVFNTGDGSTTTVTGSVVSAGDITISQSGTVKFTTTETKTGTGSTGNEEIRTLGNWEAEGNLEFKNTIVNGFISGTCNDDALISVKGTLTLNKGLENAGRVTAQKIDGDGTISNYCAGNNAAPESVSIKAEIIDIGGNLVNGKSGDPSFSTAIIEAGRISAANFTQHSGKTIATDAIRIENELLVNAGEVDTGTLAAKTFRTREGSVVSFTDLELTPDNPGATQDHSGWLKSKKQDFVYNAKFQLNGTGKLTNAQDGALDSVTVNGVSVLMSGAQIKTQSYAAQGLNNQTNFSIEKVVLTSGEYGDGFLWNTNGAEITIGDLQADSVSNGPNTINEGSTLITITDSLVADRVDNHKNDNGAIGRLVVNGNAVMNELANSGDVKFESAQVDVGSITAADSRDEDATQVKLETGSLIFNGSTVNIGSSSTMGNVTVKDSSITLGAGDYGLESLNSGNSTFHIKDIAGKV